MKKRGKRRKNEFVKVKLKNCKKGIDFFLGLW